MLNRATLLASDYQEVSSDEAILIEAMESNKELLSMVVAHLLRKSCDSLFVLYHQDGDEVIDVRIGKTR